MHMKKPLRILMFTATMAGKLCASDPGHLGWMLVPTEGDECRFLPQAQGEAGDEKGRDARYPLQEVGSAACAQPQQEEQQGDPVPDHDTKSTRSAAAVRSELEKGASSQGIEQSVQGQGSHTIPIAPIAEPGSFAWMLGQVSEFARDLRNEIAPHVPSLGDAKGYALAALQEVRALFFEGDSAPAEKKND